MNLFAQTTAEDFASNEVKMWKAYYRKDRVEIKEHLGDFLKYQYRVTPTEEQIELYSTGVLAFAVMPQEASMKLYVEQILPFLNKAFASIRSESSLSFDPENHAMAELSWWVTRRDTSANNPENIGKLMEESYRLLYGPGDYTRTSYLRASAARYRDICADHLGGGVQDSDWATVQSMLENAYRHMPS